ncbi:MAG: hypothetical protein DRP65_10400 [Planctomycetota bacterium]|mgnify:CR=1 FL=1|nr:MAG: hypothetical protein DRP65_10400 [Planctomycetota bacterium]
MWHCTVIESESSILVAQMLSGSAHFRMVPATWLLFSPLRIILLVVWVYFVSIMIYLIQYRLVM